MAPLIERLLIRHEGVELEPYFDTVGKQSVGVGFNLTDRGVIELESIIGRDFKGLLSYDEAIFVMRHDIITVQNWMEKKYPWYRKMNDVRQSALEDFGYNVGPSVFGQFKHHTLKLMREGAYTKASQQWLLSKWASQVGKKPTQRAGRLAIMMRTGEAPDGI